MKRVYKYQVFITDPVILMPKDAEILHVGSQRGNIFVWALVDPSWPPIAPRHFVIYSTGLDIYEPDESLTYLGTCFQHGDALVLHIFERKN